MPETKNKLVFERLFEIIEDPAHWTQYASYRDADNIMCSKEKAVKYCLLSAFTKAHKEVVGTPPPLGHKDAAEHFVSERKTFDVLRRATGPVVTHYNDTHTHKQVLSCVKAAAEVQ